MGVKNILNFSFARMHGFKSAFNCKRAGRTGLSLLLFLSLVLTAPLTSAPWFNTVAAADNTTELADNNLLSGDGVSPFSGPFLSELSYESESKSGWKGIILNKNTDNLPITLLQDGEVVAFSRGIAAHAAANVIYDLNNYREYSHFFSYLGLDARQNGQGDGAAFKISVSDDKNSWQELYRSETLHSDRNAVKVDLDLQGKRYLRLETLPGASNSHDHTVFAYARLHKPGEGLREFFPTLASLQEQVNAYLSRGVLPAALRNDDLFAFAETATEDSKNFSKLLWRTQLLKLVGTRSLNLLYDDGHGDFLKFLWNDHKVLQAFLAYDNVDGNGSYLAALQALSAIYAKYSQKLALTDENYFYLRLALSVAHAYGRESMVKFWEKPDKGADAVRRFEIYVSLLESKIMDYAGKSFAAPTSKSVAVLGGGPLPAPEFVLPDTLGNIAVGQTTASGDTKLEESDAAYRWSSRKFVDLPLPLMKWVVDARMNDDEFAWLRDYAYNKDTKDWGRKFDAYTYIKYTLGYNYGKSEYYDRGNFEKYNAKYQFANYFNDYETPVKRLWHVFEDGAVCGGLAKTYANLAEVFGRPSAVTAQPGHAATLTYVWNDKLQRYVWTIQNNISGWQGSNNEFNYKLLNWGREKVTTWMNASYTAMASDAIASGKTLLEADAYVAAAGLASDRTSKESLLRKAIEAIPYHEKAYLELINLYKEAAYDETAYVNLAKEIIRNFAFYPLALTDMLKRIESHIVDVNNGIELRLLKQQALERAKKATVRDVYQPDICIAMAKNLSGSETGEFATFSFDGDNAGKIVLDEQYRNSSIRLRYSLDNGQTWQESNEQVLTLSAEELEKITPENDILVGLRGTEAVHRLDILPSKRVSNGSLTVNTLERTLVGDIEALEYRFADSEPWQTYTSDITFDDEKVVLVRYRANGRRVASQSDRYTFPAPQAINPKEKYIPIKHLNLAAYSSQQSDTFNHAARNMLDASPFTAWHTEYNAVNDERYFTMRLDEPRYVSAVDYRPGGRNGRFKKVTIATSLDGINFEEVVTNMDLEDNDKLKHLSFTATPALYVKITAIETYGNSEGEKNKYASGKFFNFYEDSTQTVVMPTVSIKYEPATLTNSDVTASLILPQGFSADVSEYVFTANGEHVFTYTDAAGKEASYTASVSWIDKEAPFARLVYTPDTATDGTVCVSISDYSEDLAVVEGFPPVNSANGEASVGNVSTFALYADASTASAASKDILNDKRDSVALLNSDADSTGDVVADNSELTAGGDNSDTVADNGTTASDSEAADNWRATEHFDKLCSVFYENGENTYVLYDKAGNKTVLKAVVTWINAHPLTDTSVTNDAENATSPTVTSETTTTTATTASDAAEPTTSPVPATTEPTTVAATSVAPTTTASATTTSEATTTATATPPESAATTSTGITVKTSTTQVPTSEGSAATTVTTSTSMATGVSSKVKPSATTTASAISAINSQTTLSTSAPAAKIASPVTQAVTLKESVKNFNTFGYQSEVQSSGLYRQAVVKTGELRWHTVPVLLLLALIFVLKLNRRYSK